MSNEPTFTRREIAQRVGVGEDVLAFWIKNGLLVASEGGAGKGSHRRFGRFQVNIAAVLAELRRFGVNVGALRSFGALLQRGTALGETAECNFWAIQNAVDLRQALDRFEAGQEVEIWPRLPAAERPNPWEVPTDEVHAFYEKLSRPAASAEEVIEFLTGEGSDIHDLPENVKRFAERITAADILPLELFQDMNGLAFRYLYDGHVMDFGCFDWLLVPEDGGGWEVFRSPENHELLGRASGRVRSGLFLAPGTVYRAVWGDSVQPILIQEPPLSQWQIDHRAWAEKGTWMRNGKAEAHGLRLKLAQAGVRANVAPITDEPGQFQIAVAPEDWPKVEAALQAEGYAAQTPPGPTQPPT